MLSTYLSDDWDVLLWTNKKEITIKIPNAVRIMLILFLYCARVVQIMRVNDTEDTHFSRGAKWLKLESNNRRRKKYTDTNKPSWYMYINKQSYFLSKPLHLVSFTFVIGDHQIISPINDVKNEENCWEQHTSAFIDLRSSVRAAPIFG